MKEQILKNIAYIYYPKGIDREAERENYLKSIEFLRLKNTIDTFFLYENTKKTYDDLVKNLNRFPYFNDMTLLHSLDRCLCFEIDYLESDERLSKICVLVSLLVPYYLVYVTENKITLNPYRWKTHPKRNLLKEKTTYKKQIEQIKKDVEKITQFQEFPQNLTSVIIPDINFNDIYMGDFTLFNAFFLDDDKFSIKKRK